MIRLTYFALSLLALAVGLEGATRLDEWVRWGTPFTSTMSSVNDIITIDSSGARGIPHAQYRQFALNSLGLRGPEPRGGRPRLLVLGASESFGLYEARGHEYPRQVEDSLGGIGCQIDVLNAALPGFSLPTLLASFRHSLSGLGATTAFVYPTPVQYLEVKRPVFVPPSQASPASAGGFAMLRATRRLRDHAKLVVPEGVKTMLRQREIDSQRKELPSGPLWREVPAERLDAFVTDLGALVDTLTAHGITPVLATHANAFPANQPPDRDRLIAWGKFYPQADPALLPVFDSVANVRIRALAAERGLTLVDVSAGFVGPNGGPEFADFSHFTDRGAAKMAGLVARSIRPRVRCVN